MTLLLTILTGVLGFLMYPTVLFGFKIPDCGWLAWFYLVPLLYVLMGNPKKIFRYSFLSALLFYAGSLYWFVVAMNRFGGLDMLSSLGVFLLVILMEGFFFSMMMVFVFKLWRKSHIPLALILPLALVSLEFFRTHFPMGGFAWPTTALSQGHFLFLFQWAEVTGAWGISFLLFLINACLAEILFALFYKKMADRVVKYGVVTSAFLILSLLLSVGVQNHWDKSLKNPPNEMRVGLIQGNITQDLKWDPQSARRNFKTYLSLTNQAREQGAEIVFWPETAYPYSVDLSNYTQEALIKEGDLLLPVLMGAVSEKPVPFGEEPLVYNSAFLLNVQGRAENFYHKQHLVPFGEYVPLKKWLTFAKKLTVAVGDFSRGVSSEPMEWHGKKMGLLICYEDIFPELSQKTVNAGAQVLVNLTNDAWYGLTSAPFQHLAFSQLRALENRRMLVRATNTGITAVIDPRGEILSALPLFKEGVLIYLLDLHDQKSVYTRAGDWFAWGSVFGLLILMGIAYRASRIT